MKRLLLFAMIFSSLFSYAEKDRNISSVGNEGSYSNSAAYVEDKIPEDSREKDDSRQRISRDYFEKYVHPEIHDKKFRED
ncbi:MULTISPECIES: hypothetical protein [Halobacteriovorax]|uniref:Uncharacterized protein n=1 Tax=Halobacteriovorax vibrionivorans TaxID=2152716 RepID=A0ABY0IEE9_9BACT|nr:MULTISPECIES: hypothetical protein [Halobacteriovorax]AYF44139.1 hypothetical protein BALOs_1132 [Halobacteriovorax sp. BALOs_7]RZF21336.1 hypothetical protein DAY19_06525 [Halobacteriovorax vibrionivorans]TGD47906.1 hypothetical protein EP118_05605 [Halobacteriovorax sp. Y22]